MPKNIHGDVADEVFEDVEQQLKRTIESILDIPMTIGVPDAKWKKQYGYPFGCVMIDSCKITELIDDGNPESQIEEGDKVILECEICEADMILAFHLATRKKIIADRLAFKFIKGMRTRLYIGEDNKYEIGEISFKSVLPGPEGERVFEKIFSIPLSGTLTEKVVTEKGGVEYIGEVSTSPEVLNQGT